MSGVFRSTRDAKANPAAARGRSGAATDEGLCSSATRATPTSRRCLRIYLHHIRRGVDPDVDGEFETPDAEDLKRRRKTMHRRRMPHIVAEDRGAVVGYAYAVPFRKRPAYRYTVKHSICVHNDHIRRGIGRQLMAALIDACAARGFPADDRLYRRGQSRLACAARGLRLPPGRVLALDRIQVRRIGPTR